MTPKIPKMPYTKALSDLKNVMEQERPSPELKAACAQFLQTMEDLHERGENPPTAEQISTWLDALAMQNGNRPPP